MWKFRYILTTEKNALTKFLKCVEWEDSREVQNAQQLSQQVLLCSTCSQLLSLSKADAVICLL